MHNSDFTDDLIGKAYDARLVHRLLRYVLPHARMFAVAAVLLVATTGLELLMPYLVKIGIDNYLTVVFVRYTGNAELLASCAAHMPSAVQPGPTSLLVPQRAAEQPNSPLRTVAHGQLTRDESLYYVLPADARTGDAGFIEGACWLLPQHSRARVGPLTLLRARRAELHGVTIVALLMLAVILAKLVTEYGHALLLQIAGQRAMFDLRTQLFNHIHTLSLRYFDRTPVGRLVTRATNDIEAINEVFSSVLVGLVKDLLYFAGAVIIVLHLNTRLALTALALLPLFVIVAIVFKRRARDVYREVRRHLSRLNARLNEDLSGIKIIQVFRQQPRRINEFATTNRAYLRANMNELVVFGTFRPMVDTLRSVGIALALVYGGWSVMGGVLTIGVLIAFVQYLNEMYRPIIEMSQQYTVMQSAMAAAERIFSILDEEPDVRETAAPTRLLQPRGHVVFDNVRFSYVNGTEVLKGVSFSVEPGRSIAIVGPTGAGKSSIINLACRFYDPDAGTVVLDGIDIRNYPLHDVRQQMAIVLQDAFVFSRSVADNIRLGRADITHDTITAAAGLVQARSFIEALPHGFNEEMMERGATLSSGQKQLLCFARALAHDPRILILDEATSSVDPATEQLIQHAIETLMRGRTSIVVAHRLSTIKRADEIIVLDQGHILERGSHDTLLARRGFYYNLYLLQFCHEE